jgi:hypothetical protein
MPKNKGKKNKGGQVGQSIKALGEVVKTPVVLKTDVEEDDDTLAEPEPQATPFDLAVADFDPESNRLIGKTMRDAKDAAARIVARVEEAHQLAVRIGEFKSEFVQPTQVEEARKRAETQLKSVATLGDTAARDCAAMDKAFVDGWAKAKQLPKASPNDFPKLKQTALRLKLITDLRDRQDQELKSAIAAGERVIAAEAPVDEGTGKIRSEFAALRSIVQAALTKQAQEKQAAEQRRQLELNARAALAKAREQLNSGLLERAAVAKVTPDPQIALLVAQATEAEKKSQWKAVFDLSRDSLAAARELERALRRAAGDEKSYQAESKRIFADLVSLRSDLARLKIRAEGPFAALKGFEDAAKQAASNKQWPDAAEALEQLEDSIDQARPIIAGFDKWTAGAQPMLLKATLDKVIALKNLKTNKEIQAKLEAVYEAQCNVSAANWRKQLGYQPTFKPPGQDLHYSTYIDSIVIDAATVFEREAVDICNELFFSPPDYRNNIHATYIVDGVHHHRYWDGTYSGSMQINHKNGFAANNPDVKQALDQKYQQMVDHMFDRVEDAIEKHGRVGNAVSGPTVT